MSDHGKHAEAAPAGEGNAKPSGGSIVPWIAVGVLSAGMGSALPFLLSGQQTHAASDTEEHGDEHGEGNSEKDHGGEAKSEQKKVKEFTMAREEDTIFLPSGEPGKDQSVVVNLDEGRMSRYLRVAITLQIPKAKEETFKKRIEARKIVLRNWLLSKISDLDLDDIRGAAGKNRLRREIREQFNTANRYQSLVRSISHPLFAHVSRSLLQLPLEPDGRHTAHRELTWQRLGASDSLFPAASATVPLFLIAASLRKHHNPRYSAVNWVCHRKAQDMRTHGWTSGS